MFDLNSAIAVREREDGLLEKDTFDISSAVAVDDNIAIAVNKKTEPIITKTNWILQTMDEANKQLQDLLTTPARILGTPHPPMVSGLATKTIPDLGKWLMEKEPSGYKTVIEASKVAPEQKEFAQPASNRPGFVEVGWDRSRWENLVEKGANLAVLGYAVKQGFTFIKNELEIRDLARRINTAATKMADEVANAIPKFSRTRVEGLVTEQEAGWLKERANLIEGFRGAIVQKLSAFEQVNGKWQPVAEGVKNRNMVNLLMGELRAMGERGEAIIPKIGQSVQFTNAKGELLTGVIRAITGQRAEIDMAGRMVVATLSQLSLPETPKPSQPTEGKVGYVYHGTDISNLESIKKSGLQTNVERGKTGGLPEIHFSTTEDYAGDIVKIQGKEPIILRVKSDNPNLIKPEKYPLSALSKETILPENIEIKIDNKWQPLSTTTGEGQKPPVEPPKTAVSGEPSPEDKFSVGKKLTMAEQVSREIANEDFLIKGYESDISKLEEQIKVEQFNTEAEKVKAQYKLQDLKEQYTKAKEIQRQHRLTREEKASIQEKIKRELKYTKPVKEGFKKVGKFDYETNKEFDNIRRLSSFNQAEAQSELDTMPVENQTPLDLVKARLLSLRANGTQASTELHRQVLADIQSMKKAGIEAKDELDFNNKIGRVYQVEEVSSGIAKIKGNAKSVLTKIENVYREGFSNTYSMLNSIAGKDIAAKYNPELAESNREIAIYNKTNEVVNKVMDLFGIENSDQVAWKLQELAGETFEITDLEGLKSEINKLGIIDIYNALKNDLTRERYYNAFGKEQVDGLVANLTPKEKALADYMQEVVQSYRDILNQRNIELTGRDLGEVENYWPASSEFQQSVTDDIRIQGQTPSAMKERVKSSKIIPVPKDAWLKMLKHINQGEHTQYLSREYETLKRIFIDRKIKNQIVNKFGKDVYDTLMNQFENISLNKVTERLDKISETLGWAINNWVKAKVALNPSVFVKQLISTINYAENMPVGQWSGYYFKGLAGGKSTFDFMWNNCGGFLEARFNRGYSEALQEALKGASLINKHKASWTKGLTSLARAGDITAIIYGGYPVVMTEIAKGKTMEEAFDIFRQATLQAQQSGLASSLSQFQNSKNPLARLFLAFKNTSNQYFRKQMDAIINYRNKEIPISQLAKTTIIYSVINAMLFAAVGYVMNKGRKKLGQLLFDTKQKTPKPNDDTLTSVMLTQLLTNPVQAVPVLDDVADVAVRKMLGKKTFGGVSTPVLDDITLALQKFGKKEVTLMDYFEIFGTAVEMGTGVPVKLGTRAYKDIFVGEKQEGLSSGSKLNSGSRLKSGSKLK